MLFDTVGLESARVRRTLWAAFVLSVLLAVGPFGLAEAQVGGPFPSFAWGARQKGMWLGGVGTDDAFDPLHNPAAAGRCGPRHIAVEQMRPFGVSVTAVAWCSGTPRGSALTSGAPARRPTPWSWGGHVIVRQTPLGLGFDYNTYVLAQTSAMTLAAGPATVHFGVTAKLLLISVVGTEGYDDEAVGYGADVGLRVDVPLTAEWDASVFDTISIGVAALDVVSRLSYGRGTVEAGAPSAYTATISAGGPRLRLGVGVRPGEGGGAWNIGAEYVLPPFRIARDLLREVALRAGSSNGQIAVGIGVTLPGFRIDYAHVWRDAGSVGDAPGDGLHAISTRFYY